MATAGYSGTPLWKKLGLTSELKLLLINMPAAYPEWVQADIPKQLVKAGETPDWVHLFAADQKAFLAALQQVLPYCKKNPALVIWVSWYKKSSGITTDITEDIIRNTALQHGLVDVKVCAVTEQWSALKLVVPLKKR